AIQAAHSATALAEDAAVEEDFGISGKQADDFFMQAFVQRLLESLMKLAQGFFRFQQGHLPCGPAYPGCRFGLGHAHGGGHRRGSTRAQPRNERATAVHHAPLFFGPKYSRMSNLPM